MLNIHPALLPQFKGLHTHRRALEAGVERHGATVHFVVPEMDSGPIVAQESVPVLDRRHRRDAGARVLEVEHRIYPQALRLVAEGRATFAPPRNGLPLVHATKNPQTRNRGLREPAIPASRNF